MKSLAWTSASPFRGGQGGTKSSNSLFRIGSPGNQPSSLNAFKSHLNSKNLVVVKKGLVMNNRTPLWLWNSFKNYDRDQLLWQKMLLLLLFPRKFPGCGELWTRNCGWKNMYIFLVMWQNSYISYKSQYYPWQIDLVDVIKLKMRFILEYFNGQCHHRSIIITETGWRDVRKD